MIENADMTSTDMIALKQFNSFMFHKSNFSFLNQQNGWRDGQLHTILGSTGSGKSTFIRSIIYDFLLENPEKTVLIYLSEEMVHDFKLQFSYNGALSPMLKRIHLISEIELPDSKKFEGKSFVAYRNFFQSAEKLSPDLILIDNFTTSQGYQDLRPGDQGKIMHKIKKWAIKLACPILAVMHTNKNVSRYQNRLLTENDVRGSATLGNISEFFYTMQRVTDKETGTMVSFIQTVKHRGQEPENLFFIAKYSKSKRIFTSDLPVDFKKIKELFNNATC